MKIKMSRSQWDKIGKDVGWIKKSQTNSYFDDTSIKEEIDQLKEGVLSLEWAFKKREKGFASMIQGDIVGIPAVLNRIQQKIQGNFQQPQQIQPRA